MQSEGRRFVVRKKVGDAGKTTVAQRIGKRVLSSASTPDREKAFTIGLKVVKYVSAQTVEPNTGD